MTTLLTLLAALQLLLLLPVAVGLLRVRRRLRVLWRVFVTRGEAPMGADAYAAYRQVQYLAACLAEEDGIARVLLVETAPGVQRALVDVSSRGQFTFLLEHMRRHGVPPADEQVVVDLGANEGLQGSHSFNLVQLGWWAALVEANPALEPALRRNTRRARWLGHEQRVVVRAVAVTDGAEGERPLHVRGWRHTATSLRPDPAAPGFTVLARAESVPALATALDRDLRAQGLATGLPRRFGVLSVDIEGPDFEVVRGFLEAGYRPQYVVVEERTDLARYDELLGPQGYARLAWFDADAIYARRGE